MGDWMTRLNILTGDFGSGKTEVSINFAQYLVLSGNSKVALVDLDIVNPYFRSREAADLLAENGVEVIYPTGEVAQADLPIITPVVYKVLQNKEYTAVFDVGGDDIGARALGSLYNYFKTEDYQMILVVNNNRPFTRDLQGVLAMKDAIERTSRLKINALIANPNLGCDTTPRIIEVGHEMIQEFAEKLKLPLLFTAITEELIDSVNIEGKILPLKKYMKQPW